ncbi:MAG: chemotaxis protein CheW [Cytophagales bacterium]|nr:chemotaxis protein CheW [Cytophagales bacterium]MDW8383178.1 chemotaxis protein CheW [Flammeovirgaceae bacterium]
MASIANTNSGKSVQLIVFKLGNEEYGFRIDSVKEVVLTPTTTKVPLTPAYLVGVANIRGEILPVIDLAKRLCLPFSSSEAKYTLVVESGKFKLGILSAEVPNTLTVNENAIDTQLSALENVETDRKIVNGLVKLGTRLIILLNVHQLVLREDFKSSPATSEISSNPQ